MFTFLHAADIHLDSALSGLPRSQGAPPEWFATATREAFRNLVELAIHEGVAFLILAGDLYDGDWKDVNTGFFFAREMGRLREAGIPVFLLRGNHDAESQITRSLRPPGNVHRFSTRKAQSFRLKEPNVALHGWSYREREVRDNLVPGYPEPVPGALNIGVLHTALEGDAAHALYAPCSVAELRAKGYQYWALGHVHQWRVVERDPFIVFPGNLQGRNIRETGPKGAALVRCEEDRVLDVQPVYVDVVRWARLEVDAAGASTRGEVLDRVESAMDSVVRQQAGGRPVVLRVAIGGRTAAHGVLLRDEDSLKEEIQAAAAGLGNDGAWVEKVEIATEPERAREAVQARRDAVGELERMLREAPADATLVEAVRADLNTLLARLPSELRASDEAPAIAQVREQRWDELLREVAGYLTARVENLQE